METQINTTNLSLLVDVEGAYIPSSEASLSVKNKEKIQRSRFPFSEMKIGKFRKLFDRHTLAYKH